MMRNKKYIIILVILLNIIALINALYFFHYKEKWFDKTQHPKIDIKNITKIEIREGMWKWNTKEWKHTNNTKLIITDKTKIIEFCEAMLTSNSKYINNIRPNNWLNIYFYYNYGEEELSVVLKENNDDGIFFEYHNNSFEGKKLSKVIQTISTN
jgi:fumarate reductase subunit C